MRLHIVFVNLIINVTSGSAYGIGNFQNTGYLRFPFLMNFYIIITV